MDKTVKLEKKESFSNVKRQEQKKRETLLQTVYFFIITNSSQIRDLYTARCKDSGFRPSREEAEHWQEFVMSSCVGNKFLLAESHLGPYSMDPLLKLLNAHDLPVYTLGLMGNGIKDDGFTKLNDYLTSTSSAVRYLDLRANDITDRSAFILEHLLSINNTISTLVLGSAKQKKLLAKKGEGFNSSKKFSRCSNQFYELASEFAYINFRSWNRASIVLLLFYHFL